MSLGLVGNREEIQDRDQKQIPPCHYFGLFTDFFLFSFEIVPTEKIGPLPSTFLNSQVFTQEINKQKKTDLGSFSNDLSFSVEINYWEVKTAFHRHHKST